MTHEHPQTSHPRRRDIHRPVRPRRTSLLRNSLLRTRPRWDRRVVFGVPATLGLVALSASLVSGASASADTTPAGARPAVVAAFAATPSAHASAAPAVVADAQVALERAEQLTTESRAVAAKQRKKIKARSAELRALMGQRTDAAASRSSDREPLQKRADEARAGGEAASAATAQVDETTANAEPVADAAAETAAETPDLAAAPPATPGPLLATPADEFVTPSLTTDIAPLTDAVAVDDAGAAIVAATSDDTTEVDATAELKRATDALTRLIRDTEADAIEPAPATPKEVLAAQARAAKKAAPELAKQAKSLAGHENGEIPPGELCELSFAAGKTLRCDAAQQLERLDKAYRARFEAHLTITDSYRSYAAQVATAASRGYLAAVPGYSNHGWAVAVDLGGGVQQFGTAQHEWMREHARAFGWIDPDWARSDGRKPEAWHWEYTGL